MHIFHGKITLAGHLFQCGTHKSKSCVREGRFVVVPVVVCVIVPRTETLQASEV